MVYKRCTKHDTVSVTCVSCVLIDEHNLEMFSFERCLWRWQHWCSYIHAFYESITLLSECKQRHTVTCLAVLLLIV